MARRERLDEDEPGVLEGDEDELEVGRHRDVGREVLSTPIADLHPAAAPEVRADAPAARAVDLMRTRKASAVAVVDRRRKRLLGIFTERDLVERALPSRGWAKAPVSRYMTPAPEALRPQDPIAYALNRMAAGRFCHVPLVDAEGRPAGMVSASDLLAFVVELCPEEVLNLPSAPELANHPRAEGD